MRVFISWSGDLSGALAQALRRWLPKVIQSAKPYFSPTDIDKGSRWASDLAKELESTLICIVALTRDNLQSPWIMFEAGAISKTIEKTHICAILFGVEKTEVQGPLAQFQATNFVKEEMQQLLATINRALGDERLSDADFLEVFEVWWPRLEKEVSTILKATPSVPGVKAIRADRDLLIETLELVRRLQQTTEDQKDEIAGLRDVVMSISRFFDPPLGIEAPARQFVWSEESEGLLRQLWINGLSATEIAGRLGTNRNAVIAKVHRLGLSRRRPMFPNLNTYDDDGDDSIESETDKEKKK